MPHGPGWCGDCRVTATDLRVDGTYPKRCQGCAKDAALAAKAARNLAKKRKLCQFTSCKLKALKNRTMCREHLAYYAERARVAKAAAQ
jgi:hypothetical protein